MFFVYPDQSFKMDVDATIEAIIFLNYALKVLAEWPKADHKKGVSVRVFALVLRVIFSHIRKNKLYYKCVNKRCITPMCLEFTKHKISHYNCVLAWPAAIIDGSARSRI